MKHVALIACCKGKLSYPAPARELYQGSLFKKSLAYVTSLGPDTILILSALHGVVHIDQVIEPYEVTLNTMKRNERDEWTACVLGQLRGYADLEHDRFTFLAGARYREGLVKHIKQVEVPLEGMGIGVQLQWLKRVLSS